MTKICRVDYPATEVTSWSCWYPSSCHIMGNRMMGLDSMDAVSNHRTKNRSLVVEMKTENLIGYAKPPWVPSRDQILEYNLFIT